MILAVVGSTCLAGNAEARLTVEDVVDRHLDVHSPLVVCSGAARGVDAFAAEAATARGALRIREEDLARRGDLPGDLFLLEFPPLCRQRGVPPAGHRCTWRSCFQPRDRQIAETCDALVRVRGRCSTSYGSGWTRDVAARLGKPTEEIVVSLTDEEVLRLARTAVAASRETAGLFPDQDAEAAVRIALARQDMDDEVRVRLAAGAVELRRRGPDGERLLASLETT